MAVTGTVYAAVSTGDQMSYAYVDMGCLTFSDDRPRKSGMVDDLADVPKMMVKLERARQKSLYLVDQRFPSPGYAKTRQAEYDRLNGYVFGVVKITVEEVDPSLY